ncbi:hypothetical protein G2W53_023739 [Senna tora]|uniref:Uncharacterized protein n=1 Tax=Senna tora TaxID=362788 RepID=A0A834WIH3_9FABA|nr:hypothetical protein G2W53_023739 [Senna tora]
MAISSKSVSSSSSSPPAKTTATQNKPTRPQNVKVHSEEAEVIPIKFDYSTPISKPAASSHVRITDQQGKKDINYAVTEYLERVGGRIRAVSNVGGGRGQGQGEGPPDDEADNKKNKKKDNHRDYFSNFIHIARNNLIPLFFLSVQFQRLYDGEVNMRSNLSLS